MTKSSKLVLGQVYKVSVYQIVKDVANLITSSENHCLMVLSGRVSHVQTGMINTSKFGQLTCFKSLWDIINIAKIQFDYFQGVCLKLCKFNALHNPSRSRHYNRPHYSFRCNIKSKHLHEYNRPLLIG